MKIRDLAFITLIFMVLTTGCFEERLGEIVYEEYVPPTPAPSGGAGIGMGIYNQFCAGCHALSGKGAGMPNIPDFSDSAYWDAHSDEDVTTAIKDGTAGSPMPGWADKLSEEEIGEILVYSKSFAGL